MSSDSATTFREFLDSNGCSCSSELLADEEDAQGADQFLEVYVPVREAASTTTGVNEPIPSVYGEKSGNGRFSFK